MGDDEKSCFLELVHNTQICLTEISGDLGDLTVALLRREVFTNHEIWKKCQKVLLKLFLPEV